MNDEIEIDREVVQELMIEQMRGQLAESVQNGFFTRADAAAILEQYRTSDALQQATNATVAMMVAQLEGKIH